MADAADITDERISAELEERLARRVRYEGISAEECGECGDEIPPARRLALPGVTRCVTCADIAERRR